MLIYIPANKALVAVEKKQTEKSCADCDLCFEHEHICQKVDCDPPDREDGKAVIFKFVDYKEDRIC